MLLLGSTARTTSVWSPAGSVSASVGSAAEAQASNPAPSTLHSNEASGSLLEKTNSAGVPSAISAGGPDTIVAAWGAVRSTIVHSQTAGTTGSSRSGLSAVSSKVC